MDPYRNNVLRSELRNFKHRFWSSQGVSKSSKGVQGEIIKLQREGGRGGGREAGREERGRGMINNCVVDHAHKVLSIRN